MSAATDAAAASPSTLERARELLRRHGPFLRDRLLPQLVGLTPAVFLIVFLRRMSGSALWIPNEWRLLVGALGVSLGLTLFNLTRLHHEGQSTCEELESDEARERRREFIGLRRGLYCLLCAATLMVGYHFLRGLCVLPFQPYPDYQEKIEAYFTPEGGDVPEEIDALRVADKLNVDFIDYERSGGSWSGTILMPLFPGEDLRYRFDLIRDTTGQSPRQVMIQEHTEQLVDLLIEDGAAIKFTSALFLLLLLGSILAASAGFGLVYDFGEELLDHGFGFFA